MEKLQPARKRSIFIGLKSYYEPILLEKTVGDVVKATVNFLGFLEDLSGKVVFSKVSAHGKFLLLKNSYSRYESLRYACTGWDYIPLWISACGQSGVLAPWKDEDANRLILEYQNKIEREVDCSMAL